MPPPPPGDVRRFPTGSEYAAALQNTSLCFRDSDLHGATPELTRLGLPRAISGNFASVFSLTSPASGARYAVKCFTRCVSDQNDRYQAISRHLTGLPAARLSQPWNMGFDYLADEILVGSERYPVLKMEWIQGQSLASWLDLHHHESSQVGKLAQHFEALIGDLHSHGIAHGDLQHGNLLVAPDLTFRLVDYDGMYVPALAGLPGTEDGHRNYQSPLRGAGDFGPDVDRFSGWVISTALRAVAADSSLWADLHEPSGEYLLLSEDDYKAPAVSPRFARLLSHPDSDVAQSARQIADLSSAPMSAIPRVSTGANAKSAGPRPTVAGPTRGAGLPDWLRDHVPAPASSPATPARRLDQGFHHRRRARDLLVLPVLSVSFAVPLLAVLGILSVGIMAAGATVATGTVYLYGTRRSRVECQEVRQLVRELKEQKWAAQHPGAAAERLARERDSFEGAERKRAAQADQEGQRITREHQRRLAKIESDRQKQEQSLRTRMTRLDGELAADLDKRLQRHQQQYVEDHLRRSLIEKAKIPGIGRALKDALAAVGVRTAADFHGITHVRTGGRYNNVTAYVDLAHGGRVDVKGIGPAKADALEQWRNQQIAAARSRCPAALPATEQRVAQMEFQRRKADLQSRNRDIGSETARARQRAEQDLQQARERLHAEADRARNTARARREAFARRTLHIQQAATEIPGLEAALGTAVQSRRRLSAFAYLRFLVTGPPGSSSRS